MNFSVKCRDVEGTDSTGQWQKDLESREALQAGAQHITPAALNKDKASSVQTFEIPARSTVSLQSNL